MDHIGRAAKITGRHDSEFWSNKPLFPHGYCKYSGLCILNDYTWSAHSWAPHFAPDGQLEGRGLLVVEGVHLGPGLQQQPHNLLAAAADRVVQRSRVSEMKMIAFSSVYCVEIE